MYKDDTSEKFNYQSLKGIAADIKPQMNKQKDTTFSMVWKELFSLIE
jgi:hypothetical protein